VLEFGDGFPKRNAYDRYFEDVTMLGDWRVPALLVVVFSIALLLQGAAADFGATDDTIVTETNATPTENNTLVGVPGRGSGRWPNGRLLELDDEGEVVWRYKPDRTRIYDAEVLGETILVSAPRKVPAAECPAEHLEYVESSCVENRVIEVDYDTKEIVWNYSWYGERIHNSDVHDADRLSNGNTAIADMANERAIVVDPNGSVVWEWRAIEQLDANSSYQQRFDDARLPPSTEDEHMAMKREDAWLHMNDVDRLENGNIQLSLRNEDTVIEVDRESKEIVRVIGVPGNHSILYEQHNPIRLEHAGTVVVADSENDRIVELDVETNEIVWQYGGSQKLTWPRDGKRFANGNMLITDSRAGRLVEIDRNGSVVWEVTDLGNPYTAVRIGYGEDPAEAPSGRVLTGSVENDVAVGLVSQAVGLSHYVLPRWMGVTALATLLAIVLTGGWLLGVAVVPPLRRRLSEFLDGTGVGE
jgi:outer membrane protein assembly factor BamB